MLLPSLDYSSRGFWGGVTLKQLYFLDDPASLWQRQSGLRKRQSTVAAKHFAAHELQNKVNTKTRLCNVAPGANRQSDGIAGSALRLAIVGCRLVLDCLWVGIKGKPIIRKLHGKRKCVVSEAWCSARRRGVLLGDAGGSCHLEVEANLACPLRLGVRRCKD